MPWSDWVQSPNVEQAPAPRRHIEWFEADAYSIAFDLASNATDIAGAQASIDPPFRGHMGTQYRVRDSWDFNTFLPPELGAMTQGVDFDIKPGADPTDLYRFVDYDPTDHAEVVGWTVPAPVVYDRMSDFDLGANVWVDPVTDYDAGVVAPLNVGVTFDTISPTTPAGTVLATPPDPGSTLSFTVGISPHLPLDNEGAVNVIMTGSLFTSVWPRVTVRPQRWRYWIPRELPLRQKQRKDGLALRGAPAWRNQQSRQATNAWRSHL